MVFEGTANAEDFSSLEHAEETNQSESQSRKQKIVNDGYRCGR